jgi:nitrate reductase gamma subunit
MSDTLFHILFVWYPYFCLGFFVVGSLFRFERDQYSWRAASSQLLRRRLLMWGSPLFHFGILFLFLGHFVGLLTPTWVYTKVISIEAKQALAVTAGGIAGSICFIGLTMLLIRRLFDARIRVTSTVMDMAILVILWVQLALGLLTLPLSLHHMDGSVMLELSHYVQGVLTLEPNVDHYLKGLDWPYLVHLVLGMTVFLLFPFSRLVHIWSVPIGYLGRKGYQVVRAGRSRPRVTPPRTSVTVNGVAIPHDVISREVQHHPSPTPLAGWQAAAWALVVRELLLQEAKCEGIEASPLDDGEGRRETNEEALMRSLVEREVRMSEPDEAACRRYYEANIDRFRSADIFEAAHILIAVDHKRSENLQLARQSAVALTEVLRKEPGRFAELAAAHSACPSASSAGSLGQFTRGSIIEEFEQALGALAPGEISAEPVESRYGFHIIRLDRRVEGRRLPFEIVAGRIAAYLAERSRRAATAQFIARLASRATISGIELPTEADVRV